jgi:hypothetical protein
MPVTTDTVVVPAETKKVAKIKSMPVGSEGFFWLNFSKFYDFQDGFKMASR